MRTLLAFALFCLTAGSLAATYDVAADWQGHVPQSGLWRYGTQNPDGTFHAMKAGSMSASGFVYEGPKGAAIWRNDTSDSLNGIEPGHVSIRATSAAVPVDIQFTAHVTGYFKIVGRFGPSDDGTSHRTQVLVRKAKVWIQAGALANRFAIGVNLHAGDTIDFVVDQVSSAGDTQIDANISPLSLVGLTFSDAKPIGGDVVPATVTLDGPAPAGGATIALSSSTSAGSVPPSVVIPEGATDGNFDIETHPVDSKMRDWIQASFDKGHLRKMIPITQPEISGAQVTDKFVKGGDSTTGSATLSGPAGPAGVYVTLTSDHPDLVSMPSTLFILPGETYTTFTIHTSPVSETTKVKITCTTHQFAKSIIMNIR